jgi:hypothetical protein
MNLIVPLARATQAPPLGEEQRLRMESHHDGDETEGSVYSFVQASRSVRRYGRPEA